MLAGAVLIMTTSSAQQIQPGDRPSGNIRGTRSPAVGRHGMIATSQSLASAAGLKVLQDGGNADRRRGHRRRGARRGRADDERHRRRSACARLRREDQEGLRSRRERTLRRTRRRRRSSRGAGSREMPGSGPLSVDVPGVVEGWHQLLTRFGTITLAKALAPAIGYARDGFPVAELMAERVAEQREDAGAPIRRPRRRSCPTASRRRRATSSPTRGWRAASS